jgi:hypothetical protein
LCVRSRAIPISLPSLNSVQLLVKLCMKNNPLLGEITASTKGVTLREPPNFITRRSSRLYISSRTQGVSTLRPGKTKISHPSIARTRRRHSKTHNQTADERSRESRFNKLLLLWLAAQQESRKPQNGSCNSCFTD